MYYLYILKSTKDNKGYIGTTNNLEKRLREHNSGKVKSTRYRVPLIVVYCEKFNTLSEARKREWFFKCTPQGGKLRRKILATAGMAVRRT
jgi:putative endonuclease